jgi:hypothetical protein
MLSEFTRDKSRAHLVMLAAIVLQFVSYFFLYGDGSNGSSSMVVGPDFSGSIVFLGFGGAPHGTGWENNLLGWPILVVLAFAFLSSQVYSNPLFQKHGWWLGLILVVGCNLSSDGIRAFGSTLGLISILLALVAAVMHQLAQRKAKA